VRFPFEAALPAETKEFYSLFRKENRDHTPPAWRVAFPPERVLPPLVEAQPD
jgi:hypothetical protein